MATKPKALVGVMQCMCCGEVIPVKAADNGTINAACPWCDFPAWAKAGTKAHQLILAKVKRTEPDPVAAPAPAAKANPAPAPAKAPAAAPASQARPRNSIFDLGA